MSSRKSGTHRVAAAATINSSDLNSILSLASVSLSHALKGKSPPPKADRAAAQERIDRMRDMDTQRLKEKVSKGDADEEQVTALVKELCAWQRRTFNALLPLSLSHTHLHTRTHGFKSPQPIFF